MMRKCNIYPVFNGLSDTWVCLSSGSAWWPWLVSWILSSLHMRIIHRENFYSNKLLAHSINANNSIAPENWNSCICIIVSFSSLLQTQLGYKTAAESWTHTLLDQHAGSAWPNPVFSSLGHSRCPEQYLHGNAKPEIQFTTYFNCNQR